MKYDNVTRQMLIQANKHVSASFEVKICLVIICELCLFHKA